jgi:signal transduction histidine kinase
MLAAGAMCLVAVTALADDKKPTADEVMALTLKASQLVTAEGIDKARIAFDKDGEYKYGEIYVNVIDSKGAWVVYPPKPEGVGRVVLGVQDADGKFIVRDILKVAADSGEGWTEYRWKNPATNLLQLKETYVKKVTGTDYIVYVGVYK